MAGPSNHPAAGYPSWLQKSVVPLTVVVGPPGNGARAYVDAHAGAEDLVLDIAEIIAELASVPAHRAGPDWIVPALRLRNEALERLSRAPDHPAAWLLAAAPFAWQRDFWSSRGAVVQLLDPGKELALIGARAEVVPERFVHQWYAEAATAPLPATGGVIWPGKPYIVGERGPELTTGRLSAAKRGYGNEHRVIRDRQLAREPWCRFCWEERQTKVAATILDHIKAFRSPEGTFDGKLWGDPKNHRSLCQPCHDARGATRSRAEKPPGAGRDGRPLDPSHPWSKS